MLGGHWCDIVLKGHAPTEDKIDDMKASFYEELERVSDKFPKCRMKIMLRDFNADVHIEDIFKPTIGNENLHKISNNNGIRFINSAISKNLTVKSTVFPHRNIHKFTWRCTEGKTYSQINHILADRRGHSSVLDVRSFRAADCDTDHYLVVAKLRRDWQ
jgi:hypothetical protein